MILREAQVKGKLVQEEAFIASKPPGRQTVPRVEIWVVLMILMVSDGSYALAIVHLLRDGQAARLRHPYRH